MPNFKSLSILSETFVAIEMKALSTTFNMPRQIGFCVLDESKLSLYNFVYDWVLPKIGPEYVRNVYQVSMV